MLSKPTQNIPHVDEDSLIGALQTFCQDPSIGNFLDINEYYNRERNMERQEYNLYLAIQLAHATLYRHYGEQHAEKMHQEIADKFRKWVVQSNSSSTLTCNSQMTVCGYDEDRLKKFLCKYNQYIAEEYLIRLQKQIRLNVLSPLALSLVVGSISGIVTARVKENVMLAGYVIAGSAAVGLLFSLLVLCLILEKVDVYTQLQRSLSAVNTPKRPSQASFFAATTPPSDSRAGTPESKHSTETEKAPLMASTPTNA